MYWFFFEKIKELGSLGKLNVNELVLVMESFVVGYIFLKCVDGLLIWLSIFLCGMFYMLYLDIYLNI